jgi:hypothetical protein
LFQRPPYGLSKRLPALDWTSSWRLDQNSV